MNHGLRTLLYWSFVVGAFSAGPQVVHAQMLISEIAWMGTAIDANDEWIELYNQSGGAVDLSGWTLTDGDTLSIALSGTLAGGATALLERSDDASVPDVAAFHIYTGALANAGRTLTLSDASGTEIDRVVGGENWTGIGGDNEHKETPQRTGAGTWVTAPPTPGTAYTEDIDPPASTGTNTTASASSRGPAVKARIVERAPEPRTEPAPLAIDIDALTVAYVHQPISFALTATGGGPAIRSSLRHQWNFGDTATSSERAPTHAFAYPGEYVVVADAQFAGQSAIARHEMTILPASFTLSRGPRGEVLLRNDSMHEADLSGFRLKGERTLMFPRHTILKAGATLTIPSERLGSTRSVILFDPGRMHVATLGGATTPKVRTTRAAPAAPPQTTGSATPEEPTSTVPTGVIRIGTTTDVANGSGGLAAFFTHLATFFGL